MNPALIAFIVVLTIVTAALWLRLVRVILRGEWPPVGLPQDAKGPSTTAGRPPPESDTEPSR